MLVKFHSSTSGEILMFADTARQVVAILAKSPTARGVITAEQMPEAIARVQAAIARAKGEKAPEEQAGAEPPVGMVQRLVPFLDLLQRTLKDEGYVMWEAPADFGA